MVKVLIMQAAVKVNMIICKKKEKPFSNIMT